MNCNRFKSVILRFLLVALESTGVRANPDILFEESFHQAPPPITRWNLCQFDPSLFRHVAGEEGHPNSALRIGIDAELENPECNCVWKDTNKCTGPSAFGPEIEPTQETGLLTPDLPEMRQLREHPTLEPNPCAGFERRKDFGNAFAQKNEIRLYAEDWYPADIGHWFSFRFKIDGKIEPCGSLRWVGGQFKAAGMDSSPFIAQRFDNGVFHITIEALHHKKLKRERVIVAKAEGNPDNYSRWQSSANRDSKTCDMSSGKPDPEGCGFLGQVVPAAPGKMLPSVEHGNWIQMDYYIRIQKGCDCAEARHWPRKLEIWANNEKISEVTGGFGALEAFDAKLKFKIGVYRDYQAGEAGLVIDQLTIRADPDQEWSPKLRSEPDG